MIHVLWKALLRQRQVVPDVSKEHCEPSHPTRLEFIVSYLFVTKISIVVKLCDEACSKCSAIYYSSISVEYMKLDT